MGAVTTPEFVLDRRFWVSLQLAAAIHALAVVGLGLYPHDKVTTLPVKTLNIRIGNAAEFLGGGGGSSDSSKPASSSESGSSAPVKVSASPAAVPSAPAAPSASKSSSAMTAALPTFTPKAQQPEAAKTEPAPTPKAPVIEKRVSAPEPHEISDAELKKELSKPAAPSPAATTPPAPPAPASHEASRLIRNRPETPSTVTSSGATGATWSSEGASDTAGPQTGTAGSGTGGAVGASGQGGGTAAPTAQQAEAMARYEQVLSQWLQRHKKYPPEARAQNLEGQAVIRLRIDRMGNVKFYRLQQRTGSDVLDRAALEMVRAANPVPTVPDEYPAGTLLEFLVPVHFTLR